MNELLVVDDEKLIRNTLEEILERDNFNVKSAESVEDALKCLSNYNIQVVICDIKLPQKSGIDLIKLMREKNFYQPVILITGYPDFESAQKAVKMRAYDYLTKPIDYKNMLKVVQNAVRQYKLQLEEDSLEERKRKYNNDLELLVAEKMKDLNESEIKYKNLIEQSLVGVCVLQDGKFQYVSPKFLELFGYTFGEVVENLNLFDIVAHKDRPLVEKYHNKILKGILSNKQFSFTAIDKSKQEIEVEVWWGNVIYEGNNAVQAIISDISERKVFHIKEKSYELRMMNEQKLASIGHLATGIAHNLNTPISVIMSNAEILQLKHTDSSELDKIIRQAERMSAIIRGLLTKSKQEQNQYAQMIDLNKLITNELEFLNANLEFKHNVEKEYHFAEKLPRIHAVYSDFSQSIMNILQNAIDAMYKRPVKKLTVTTKLDNENIYIIISDTGIGFNETEYLKLFEPFYTTKPSPVDQINDEPSGTGLGLSTVHNLLTPYGIEIEVESKLNVGTKFSLCVPLNQVSTPRR